MARFFHASEDARRNSEHEGFGDALGALALDAESGRKGTVRVEGDLLLAWTDGDHTIHLPKPNK